MNYSPEIFQSASLQVAVRPGPSGHKLDGTQFGSKSSYFSVANTDDSSLEVKINESFNVLKY